MRHGTAGRRSRNRGNGRKGNQNRMQVFDSNGPDVRIRGTAHQICEKYLALAKDSSASGDTILAQSYMQHAEHYQRIINEWQAAKNARDERNNAQDQNEQNTKAKDDEDDLGLPSSITGEKSNSKSQKELEDA